MKALLLVNLGIAVLAAGTLVYAAVDTGPRSTLMSQPDYAKALKEIDADAKSSAIVCKRLTGYEKEVCAAEQAAERQLRMADLEARYLGTFQARHAARLTRVEAQFTVDKTRCEAFTADSRDRCLMIATQQRAQLITEAGSPA